MTQEEKEFLKIKLDELNNNVPDDIGHYEYYESGFADGYRAALSDVKNLIIDL